MNHAGVILMNRLDTQIQLLLDECKRFVKRAERLTKNYYEPPPDQSHIWANLTRGVEIVEEMVQEFEMTDEEAYAAQMEWWGKE